MDVKLTHVNTPVVLPPEDTALCTMDGPALARVALEVGLAPANAWLTPHGVAYVPDTEPQHSLWESEPWMPWRALCWEQAYALLRRLRGYGWDMELVFPPASIGGGSLTCCYYRDGGLPVQLYGSWIEEEESIALLRTVVRARCLQLREASYNTEEESL